MEEAKRGSCEKWLKTPKRLYAGGEWITASASPVFAVINPANKQTLCEVPEANAADTNRVIEAAAQAHRNGVWRNLSRRQRAETLKSLGQLIRTHRAELATLETLCNGKTYRESYEDDLPESADVFDYYAGWIDKLYGETAPVEQGILNFTRREPVGVAALIVPWNFPLLLACWKIAPALAMGNTCVVKPAPFTSLTMIRLLELAHEAKLFPPGVINLVLGGTEAGEALTRSPLVDKVSFTGSTGVGKRVVEGSAQSNLKSVSLELGGKSPNIIFEDVPDLDRAIDRAATALFSHKGEKCSEPTRFLVHNSVYDRFAAGFAQRAEAIRCGDPFEAATQQGPQCHEAHFKKVMSYLELGKKQGAKCLAGGEQDTRGTNREGFFIRPTVFSEVTSEMAIARDEIFGPVASLIRFETEEEAIRIANDSVYGLAAGLYTKDISRAHRVAEQLDAGMIFINHYGLYDFASPFGGFKQSGWGKEMALHSLESYTRLKSIWVKY